MMRALQKLLASELKCEAASVFIAVRRVNSFELLAHGEIWEKKNKMGQAEQEIIVRPVGFIHTRRVEMLDDYWGGEIAVIELDPDQFKIEAVAGLTDFSHIEVVFFLHHVPLEEITSIARHPRGRTDWPRVGIFAQRAKGRPNRLGVSRCRLLKVEGLNLTVEGLDAIDRTPILDIKPFMKEFAPRGEVRQPEWATEVMRHYYDTTKSNHEKRDDDLDAKKELHDLVE
jgi:tRNA-Thr(GGU) m(6)t(6)A37 methyltransferase TsaA